MRPPLIVYSDDERVAAALVPLGVAYWMKPALAGEFVEGSRAVGFPAADRAAIYEFLQQALLAQRYPRLNKGQRSSTGRPGACSSQETDRPFSPNRRAAFSR